MNRPWLRRAWTFQEAVLAQQLVVVCGEKSISWPAFVQGLEVLKGQENNLLTLPWMISGVEDFKAWEWLIDVWICCSRNLHRPRTTTKQLSDAGETSIRAYQSQQWDKQRKRRHTDISLCLSCLLASFLTLASFLSLVWLPAWLFFVVFGTGYLIISVFHVVFVGLVRRWVSPEWPRPTFFIIFTVSVLTLPSIGMCYQIVFRRIRKPPLTIWPPSPDGTAASTETTFRGVINAIRDRDASEPKDRAFAVYGVLQGLGVDLGEPDYDKPLGKIYETLFRALLAREPALIRLIVDAPSPTPQEAPSWVPDWSIAQKRTWLDPGYILGSNTHSATPAGAVRCLVKHTKHPLDPKVSQTDSENRPSTGRASTGRDRWIQTAVYAA
jgi:hypothetical protein